MNIKLIEEKAQSLIPLRKRLVAVVDKESKSTHTITGENGQEVKLFIERDFGWNEREKNAVNATILIPAESGIAPGTEVVCWHNAFSQASLIEIVETEEESVYGGKKKVELHPLRQEDIYFTISQDGCILPYGDHIICNRIYHQPKTFAIVLTELSRIKEDNRVQVVSVPSSIDYISPGDILIVEKMADYEVVFTLNGREERLVRIKERDIIAIDHSFKVDLDTMVVGV